MKKYLLAAAAICMVAGFTGCLKDKGYDNQEYGVQISAQKGISFPGAVFADPELISVQVSTSLQTVSAPLLSLESEDVAPQDLHVNLVANPTLVANYNASSGSNWLAMPAANYNIPSMKVTIAKGQKVSTLKINIVTTAGLDFSSIYGFGFSIGSIDEAGYTIASNMKNVVIGINVANAYSGEYHVTGYFFHPTASSCRPIEDDKVLGTVSAVGCRAPHSDLYGSNYFFDFDVSSTNALINYVARGATPNGAQSGFMTLDNPAGIAYGVTPGPGTTPFVHASYNNIYEPGSKTFLMHYGYHVGGSGQATYSRQVYEKWVKN
jgi:hypothetical protein